MNTELYHFGIKGQKWGVRRFQNEDGTLTSAGKNRYSKEDVNKAKIEYAKAKQAYKAANKRFNKSYNIAEQYRSSHPISIHVSGSEQRNKAIELRRKMAQNAYAATHKKNVMNTAKKEYKDVKKAYRAENPILSDRAKRNIKIGAAVAGTAIAAYGAYKLYDKRVSDKSTSSAVKMITQKHYYDHVNRATVNRATVNRATVNRATVNRATVNRATVNRVNIPKVNIKRTNI